jgi:O-Antigen ligase
VRVGTLLRLLPTAVLAACTWALAWTTLGSFDRGDWLGYAVGCAFVLAVLLLSGAALRPRGTAIASGAFLIGLAVWTAISLDWSPAAEFARDDGLLVAFYAVVFLIPLLSLRSDGERIGATALVVVSLGSLALAGALELRFSSHPENLYWNGRMAFPVSYPNALAAMLLVGFWPAIGLAAERGLPAVVRAAAVGSAAVMLSDLLLAQSKGGAIALGVSAAVFFCVCRGRLRALVPTLIVAAVVGASAQTLTKPYRVSGAALNSAIRHGGAVAAALAAVAVVVGLVYVLIDRRVDVSEKGRRVAGVLAAAAVVCAIIGGTAGFFATVDRPGHLLAREWRSFKHLPKKRTGSSHFFSLGSNRYDFWRVALDEFKDHPVAGIGARGFYSAYLVKGRSSETPERAHSLELDTLAETGIVGFVFLAGAGGLGLIALWPGARRSVAGAGLLAAGAYFAVHTAVDWVWTIPEVGLPALALAGIGASLDNGRALRSRVAIPAGAAALALGLFAFAPPWISSRLVDRAYYQDLTAKRAKSDLRWARRLDPIATDPYVAQAELARPPANIPPLERAVDKEPRREDLRYLLGVAYLDAGRKQAARRELKTALRLYPFDELARQALDRAR